VDPVDELKACAKITARDARYACFDSLGKRVLREAAADEESTQEEAAQPEAVATPAAMSAQPPPDERSTPEKAARPETVLTPAAISAQPPPDEKPTLEQAARPEAEVMPAAVGAQPPPDNVGMSTVGGDEDSASVKYSGTIRSCRKGHFGDWYFIFDDGQVWKEVTRRRLRFEECNFDATITKDLFGFQLWIDTLEKPIRVKRQQ
jgi:hypothetical protein